MSGLTLVEILMGGVVLAVAIAAIIGAYVGQVALNEHARNLSFAIQDANRVIEQIRQSNAGGGCTLVSACTPIIAGDPGSGCARSWDAWLGASGLGGGKSIQPDPANNERIVVTCQDGTGAKYCEPDQMANAGVEWHGPAGAAGPPNDDPLRLTVAVCWRHRGRVIGECSWNGTTLSASDGANDGAVDNVITSPVTLTTLVTCRG